MMYAGSVHTGTIRGGAGGSLAGTLRVINRPAPQPVILHEQPTLHQKPVLISPSPAPYHTGPPVQELVPTYEEVVPRYHTGPPVQEVVLTPREPIIQGIPRQPIVHGVARDPYIHAVPREPIIHGVPASEVALIKGNDASLIPAATRYQSK